MENFEVTELSAENTFTDWYQLLQPVDGLYPEVNITGTWTGTITAQYKCRDTRNNFTSFTPVADETEDPIPANTNVTRGLRANPEKWVRWGFKTGNYGSGTAVIQFTRNVNPELF